MKKLLLVAAIFSFFFQFAFAQTARVVGPVEKKVTDSICNALSRRDISKVTNKKEALALYTSCVMEHADLLQELAEESKVEFSDQSAMEKIGLNIATNLMKNNCANFIKLSAYFAEEKTNTDNLTSSTTGTLKRIDNKGFNYLVISENGAEKSFLWLRQFAGSEKLNNGVAAIAGKKVKISWQEIEVYLPVAKGYYKVKEITGLNFL
jgi:hypothetical protein